MKSENYLANTPYFNYEHPDVARFVSEVTAPLGDDPIQKITALYDAVRDNIRYNPYVFSSDAESFSASHILNTGESYCIPKAVLLGACARTIGIPARLGLADVKNHLSSPQLVAFLRSDYFSMHGYIELYLNGQWLKATPAFDSRLCQKMKLPPLAFDGTQDSIFQAFTPSGDQHMEYVVDHGVFDDVPRDFILGKLRHHYPHLFNDQGLRPLQSDTASLMGDISN